MAWEKYVYKTSTILVWTDKVNLKDSNCECGSHSEY